MRLRPRTWAPLLVLALSVSVPASASADDCTWQAVFGVIGGSAAGFGLVVAGYEIAGEDWSQSSPTNLVLIGVGEAVGATLGPVITCIDTERHAVPAASYIIGGAILGGAAFGVPWMVWRTESGGLLLDVDEGGADAALFMALLLPHIFLGGLAGYFTHRARDWSGNEIELSVSPSVDLAGNPSLFGSFGMDF